MVFIDFDGGRFLIKANHLAEKFIPLFIFKSNFVTQF